MKQQLFLLLLATFVTGVINAQVPTMERPLKKAVIKPVPPAPAPAPAPAQKPPAPPPAPAQKTAPVPPTQNTPPASNPPVYRMTSAKVVLLTGSDNKEFPSALNLRLFTLNTKQGLYMLPGNGLNNELKVNSSTDLGLVLNQGTNAEANAKIQQALTLDYIQQSGGLNLRIYYGPNFFMDAWKIEGVKLILEFKDQYNNPHPVYGYKTIVYNTASGFLNNTHKTMECLSDRDFNPTTSPISEYGKF
ncbi:MAG: hypothetical protein ACTHMC_02500 [Pseudobacter sp.]|uniref:hypothetical protein n=1 Tax=Pseudobacter sp. TaxID=2045420 RepID=UPI003F807D47